MFKIKLFGEIGWDIYSFEIEEMLKQANGQDVDVIFNTPGGFTSDGNIIDDAFLQYKKDFPNAQMMATIIEAQSYGSYLLTNPAFDMIVARTNSIVMIHNPLMGVIGDYRKLNKNADILERQAAMFAERYAARMKKSTSEIRSMMDDETFFIGGQEIVDSGIADDVVSDSDSLKDKMSLRAGAETRLDILKIKIRTTKEDFEKIVAMSKEQPKQSTKPATSGENNQGEISMETIEDLKKEKPEIHATVMKAGEDKGKEEMKANNKAIMEFKNKDEYKSLEFVQMRCEKAIEDGETIADLKMSVQALMLDPKNQASIESPGDISQTDLNVTMSGEQGKTEFTAEEIAEKNRVK